MALNHDSDVMDLTGDQPGSLRELVDSSIPEDSLILPLGWRNRGRAMSPISKPLIQAQQQAQAPPASAGFAPGIVVTPTYEHCDMCGKGTQHLLQIPSEVAKMSLVRGALSGLHYCNLCFWKIVEPAIRRCVGSRLLHAESFAMTRPVSHEICAIIIESVLAWIDQYRPTVPELSHDGYNTHWTARLHLLWQGQIHLLRGTSKPDSKKPQAIAEYADSALMYAEIARQSLYNTVCAIEAAALQQSLDFSRVRNCASANGADDTAVKIK